jgi:late competence protein required for DNA uptake (superfamily II DNA/RNA helicase)
VIPAFSETAKQATMSTQSLANIPAPSQAHNFPHGQNSCKRCGSPDLFIKQQSVHLGLFCRDCGLWQQWVRKSQASRYQREKVPLTAPLKPIPTPIYPEVGESIGPDVVQISAQPTDLCARVEKLERAFAGYDSQLTILVRAILNAGVLQGCKVPPRVDVSDELVDRFVRELAEDQ